MRIGTITLLFALACVCARADPRTAPAPATLAVIDTANAQDFSAALTARLSHEPGIALVERDELDRIAREKGIVELIGKSEYGKAGSLLNAQGLIILTPVPPDAKAVQVRFVAVDSGVVMFDFTVPPAPAGPQAGAIASHVKHALPKLAVRRGEAVGISMLSLRADMDTGASRETERKLNALLASRLSAVPEFFLLERRKMDSLVAEKAFEPEQPAAFWNGAWLVDGSFDPMPDKAGRITVHARLRSAVTGKEISLEAGGDADQLPQLAEEIAGRITRAVGGNASAPAWRPLEEADEYFDECVWDTERGLYSEALESAESALALGETKADLTGLHAFLLALRVSATDEIPTIADAAKSPDLPDSDRLDAALRAIADAERYRDEKMEQRLAFFNTRQDVFLRTGDLTGMVLRRTSVYLIVLVKNGDTARVATLRDAVRGLAGFDPKNGKLPRDPEATAELGPYWSRDEAEWLGYWHAVLDPIDDSRLEIEPPVLRYMARFQADEIGDCFGLTPEQKQRDFDNFVDGLASNPKTATLALMVRAHPASKVAPDARKQLYAKLLDRIWENRRSGLDKYEPVFRDPLLMQFPAQSTNFLRDFLEHGSTTGWVALNLLIKPGLIPKDQAAAVRKDFEDYKARVLATVGDPTTRANLTHILNATEDSIVAQYPDVFPKTALVPALAVTHFLTPYTLDDQTTGEFIVQRFDVAGKSAWIQGTNTSGQRRILQIDLDSSMITCLPPMPNDGDKQGLVQLHGIPDGLFSLGTQLDGNSKFKANVLCRYDEKSGQWTLRDIPLSTPQNAQVLWTDNHLYMTVAGNGAGGLLRYDWDSDQTTILASGRRKPAQNQFDDSAGYLPGGVFPGPGGRVCAVIKSNVYYVRETPGNWEKAIDFDFAQSLTANGLTLLFNWVGDLMLVDPAKPEPEYWMTRGKPVPRPDPNDPKAAWTPRLAAWTDKALWRTPDGLNSNTVSASVFGFTHDDFFMLIKTNENPMRLALRWYWRGGPPDGLIVPLSFTVPPATMDAIKAKLGASDTYGGIRYLGIPEQDPMSIRMSTAATGLVLEPIRTGIWYIPFADLDKYRKENTAANPASPQPASAAADKSASNGM